MDTRRSAGGRCVTSTPPMTIRPLVATSSPAISRSVVDLPQPDGPRSTSICPAAASKLTSSTARVVPHHRLTCWTEIADKRLDSESAPALEDLARVRAEGKLAQHVVELGLTDPRAPGDLRLLVPHVAVPSRLVDGAPRLPVSSPVEMAELEMERDAFDAHFLRGFPSSALVVRFTRSADTAREDVVGARVHVFRVGAPVH